MAIGGSAAFTRVIEMDASLSDEELEGEIALQAARHLPYPSDAAAIDFEVLHLSERDPTQVEVLLAACRRDDADLLETAVSIGGLKARVLEVEGFALARACERLQPGFGGAPDTAIFDIGANSTTLSVVAGDKLVHAREEAFGGRLLTDEIERHSGMLAAEAEFATSRAESMDEGILSNFRNALLEQMTRSLQFFYSANPSANVEQVLLTGGVAAMPAFADHASRMLGIPVAVADPFADVLLPDSMDASELTSDAPAFMLACGLALRGLEH